MGSAGVAGILGGVLEGLEEFLGALGEALVEVLVVGTDVSTVRTVIILAGE